MDCSSLQREIALGFEYSYVHDDWVTPLTQALEGLAPPQALWKPSQSSKCVWEIILHMAVWNDNIVRRVETGKAQRPPEGAWPVLPAITDDQAWDEAKARLWSALESVQRMIESTPLERIQSGPYGVGDLLCRFIHNGYHIGQITKIREWMDSAAVSREI